jgi:hypothetical protein
MYARHLPARNNNVAVILPAQQKKVFNHPALAIQWTNLSN